MNEISVTGNKTLAVISGVLSSIGLGVAALPFFPFNVIAGGVLVVGGIVCAAFAGASINAEAITKIVARVTEQLPKK